MDGGVPWMEIALGSGADCEEKKGEQQKEDSLRCLASPLAAAQTLPEREVCAK